MSSRPDPTPAPSGEKRRPYPFDQIEPKWQQRWAEEAVFHAPNPGEPGFDPSRPKFYVLDMFPYPSGSGLHVGHPEGYTATDILARYKRLRGFNVLHPMGWDAFGLPAEQYAIRTGQHPRVTTEQNVAYFKTQLTRLGFDYDWQREVNTTDPGYFKWTQWIFRLLYESWFDPARRQARPVSELAARRQAEHPAESLAERRAFVDAHRLAYVAEAPVNWCPELGTVLANEEVIDGKSEVGGFPVERRPLRQWMLRITAYADRLGDELDGLDWPDSIKRLQRNWIGRSEGAQVRFVVADAPGAPACEVFTTRPDTLFGATFLVLSPEHPLVEAITALAQRAAVAAYRTASAGKSDLERTDLAKEKTGVPTGAFAVNPVNGERLPVWIADYVLMGYGTGAIMAVPAHDERDWEFARRFGLPIRFVVRPAPAAGPDEAGAGPAAATDPAAGTAVAPDETRCFVEHERGVAVNSGFLDGLPVAAAKARVTAWLEERGQGRLKVNYKLRDWLFSRQRYWGEPFPIVWRDGFHEAVAEGELPVLPPELDDFKPAGTPEPPLARAQEWVRYSESARRETNTMPQWAGSCWYYLRFCDPRNPDRFVGAEAERYWMTGVAGPSPASPAEAPSPLPVRPGGVDLYVGGTEHAVLHLLYARFWHKVLCDRGYVSTPEPFQRLVNQGLILGEDGQKMSKRFGNVVNPLDVVADYGADALRLFEMFMGPLEQTKPWSTAGVQGVYRFLARVWRVCLEEDQEGRWQLHPAVQDTAPTPALQKVVHATIKKVTADVEALSFNTAISEMMVCVNALTNAPVRPVSAVRLLLRILNPFAPHLTEELHERLNGWFPDPAAARLLARGTWPEHDERWLVENEVEIPVQVNGKVRDRITVRTDATAPQTEAAALAAPKVREAVEGKRIVKVIVLPGKLVNVVVAP